MVITLGAPRVLGVVYGDMLEVEAPLTAAGLDWPDEEWLTLFRGYGDFPGDLEEPRLEHGKLRFEARDEDLRRAWAAIEERVRVTNRVYDTALPPRDRAEQRVEGAVCAHRSDRRRGCGMTGGACAQLPRTQGGETTCRVVALALQVPFGLSPHPTDARRAREARSSTANEIECRASAFAPGT